MKTFRIQLNATTFFWLALIFSVFIRLRFANTPFERDEGEYAYAGMMILRGELPYGDFYNMKLPGVYYLYALIFKLFGQSVTIVRLGLLGIHLLTTFFVFRIAENYLTRRAAWWAAGAFMLLSSSFHAQGWVANCEQFVNLFVAAAFIFLSRDWTKKPLFWGGLLLGIATLMKQHALHFALLPAFLLLVDFLKKRDFRRTFLFSLAFGGGYVLPLFGFLAFVWAKGIFEPFYFFIIQYAMVYSNLSNTPFENIGQIGLVLVDNIWLWLLTLILISRIVYRKLADLRFDGEWAVFKPHTEGGRLSLLLLFAFWAVCPGWYFRLHYFQYLFIPAALLMGMVLTDYENLFPKISKRLNLSKLLIISFLTSTAVQAEYLFLKSPDYVSATMYRRDYFAEFRQMGAYLNEVSKPEEGLGQLANEPQIWFYTQKQAASGFLYSYPLLENHRFARTMADKFIHETEKSQPTWFLIPDQTEMKTGTDTEGYLLTWADRFLKDYEPNAFLYRRDKLFADFEKALSPVDTTRDLAFILYKRK